MVVVAEGAEAEVVAAEVVAVVGQLVALVFETKVA